MGRKIIFLLVLMVSRQLQGQVTTHRYSQPIFNSIDITRNTSYQLHSPQKTVAKQYRMDIYQPAGDTAKKRPLMIWLHGGGFKFGNKNSRGIPQWCRDFASRGYVCVAINYKKSGKNTLTNFKKLVLACTDAMRNLQEAIDYFRATAAQWRIDTNCIILAGNSAGGMLALHYAYTNSREMKILIGETNNNEPAAADNQIAIKAVINFWGAIYDTHWLQNHIVPVVSVHGRKDKIVPYDHDKAPIYGSYAIHVKADSLGIPNALKTFELSHELQKSFNPFWAGTKTKRRWKEAGNFAATFLYQKIIN